MHFTTRDSWVWAIDLGSETGRMAPKS